MKIGEIEAIISEEFTHPAAKRAALKLWREGVREKDLAEWTTVLPDQWRVAVMNELRDIEATNGQS